MLDPRREAHRAAGEEGENLAFDRQDFVRAVRPPYSWIAAYLTSPTEPTVATIESPSAATSAAIESRSAPERAARTWPESLSSFTVSASACASVSALAASASPSAPAKGVEPRVERVVAGEGEASASDRHPPIRLDQRQHRGRDRRGIEGDRLLAAERLRADADMLGGAEAFGGELERRLRQVLRDIAVAQRDRRRPRRRRRNCRRRRRRRIAPPSARPRPPSAARRSRRRSRRGRSPTARRARAPRASAARRRGSPASRRRPRSPPGSRRRHWRGDAKARRRTGRAPAARRAARDRRAAARSRTRRRRRRRRSAEPRFRSRSPLRTCSTGQWRSISVRRSPSRSSV